MKLVRTEKEFCKENVTLDFLRRVVSIAGLHSSPLKFEESDFEVSEDYKGVNGPSTCTPWSDELENRGYVKQRNCLRIKTKRFDTDVVIWEDGRVQGYYKSGGQNYAASPIKYCNLLIEYGFIKIED